MGDEEDSPHKSSNWILSNVAGTGLCLGIFCLYFNIRFHFSTKYAMKRVLVNFCKTYLDLILFEAHSVLLIYASKRFKTLK